MSLPFRRSSPEIHYDSDMTPVDANGESLVSFDPNPIPDELRFSQGEGEPFVGLEEAAADLAANGIEFQITPLSNREQRRHDIRIQRINDARLDSFQSHIKKDPC
jgi:hypothetical protein